MWRSALEKLNVYRADHHYFHRDITNVDMIFFLCVVGAA